MTFISYAQNYEDVMLRRAFKDVDKGFYIDVGANDPITDSVTKAFYDAGWRGINIEPVSEWFEKLQQDRPEDINLQVAAGAHKGDINFYEMPGTGLSTSNKLIAKQHAEEHGFEIKEKKVQVDRLTAICEQYAHSDIHFLKIDVEGAEKLVLKGFDLKKFRPWIILIESTLPGTQKEKHESWEPLLLAADYEYIKFDGLNRFYVAKEHKKIKNCLIPPPNVFDGFILSGTGSSSFHVGVAQIQASLQETKLQRLQLEKEVQVLRTGAERYDERLHEKETTQQEYLLSMIEKETRLQETVITLTNNQQEIDMLRVSLVDSTAHQQASEATLQESKQQRQQLEKQVQGLRADAEQYDERLREKETTQQEYLLSMIEKETRLQETVITLTNNQQEIDMLRVSLVDSTAHQQASEATLQESKQQCQKLEKKVQLLLEEADQNGEKLRDNEASINWLNNEWVASKHKVDELHQSNHRWWSMADQQSKALEEVNVKVEEYTRSTHHLQSVVVGLKGELHAVYKSKSWRITWPLRKLMQFFTWLFLVPVNLIFWLFRLPKRGLCWFVIKGIAFGLKRPALKVRAMAYLRNYPNFDAKLRRLAQARGFIVAPTANTIDPVKPAPDIVDVQSIPPQPIIESIELETTVIEDDGKCAVLASDLTHLTPRARHIYVQLEAAMNQHGQEKH